MSRDSLSLYVTRGKRYSGIALAVALLGLATAMAPAQEDPPGDMAQQAALAGEQAYKLVNKNKLDEARQAYAKIVTDYQQTAYAIWDPAITAMSHVRAGEDQAAVGVIEKMIQDYPDNPFITKTLNKIGDKYRDKKKYPQALDLYQRVVDNWPQADYAVWSQKSLVTTNFVVGESQKANIAMNNLLTNFANHTQLEDVVTMLAGECLSQKRYAQSRDLYQYSLDRWPQGDNAIWTQQGLAITQIKLGDYTQALSATDNLLTEFADHPQIAKAFNKIGDHYRWMKNYDKARDTYQLVVENWPGHEYALWAQKSLVTTSYKLEDDEGAHAHFLKFIAGFPHHEKLEYATHMLSNECFALKKYDVTRELQRLIVNTWPQGKYALDSQQGIAISSIKLHDYEEAQLALEKLLMDYSNHVQIAQIINKIGDHYRWARQHEKARELYQYVVDTWPDAEYAIWAQKSLAIAHYYLHNEDAAVLAMGKLLTQYSNHKNINDVINLLASECYLVYQYDTVIELHRLLQEKNPDPKHVLWTQMTQAMMYLDLGQETEAQSLIDQMRSDFADHPELHRAVYLIGYDCYNKGMAHRRNEAIEKAKKNFEKAVEMFHIVIEDFPRSEKLAWANYLTAFCYDLLGQKEKALDYFYVVALNWPDFENAWSAQFQVGYCYQYLKANDLVEKEIADEEIRTAYEKVLESYPHCPAENAARDWLKYNPRKKK